jgi:hypothetical protein
MSPLKEEVFVIIISKFFLLLEIIGGTNLEPLERIKCC